MPVVYRFFLHGAAIENPLEILCVQNVPRQRPRPAAAPIAASPDIVRDLSQRPGRICELCDLAQILLRLAQLCTKQSPTPSDLLHIRPGWYNVVRQSRNTKRASALWQI
ncbi:MAG: hypothetical protein Q9190_005887 [Brigantiaea leucoxantha]